MLNYYQLYTAKYSTAKLIRCSRNMHKMMAFFNYSSELVGFSDFPFLKILFEAMLLVSPANLKILLVIFGVALIA